MPTPTPEPTSFNGPMSLEFRKRMEEPRSAFTKGSRMRMNIVPILLNAVVPWLIFVGFFALVASEATYYRAGLVYAAVLVGLLLWGATLFMAVRARKVEPDPTWYGYFAMVVGIAVCAGVVCGYNLYEGYTLPVIELESLRTVKGLDVGSTPGKNVMDAGTFYFAPGTYQSGWQSWHFKRAPGGDFFCVAPLVASGVNAPETQSYDFWAVGKDCCAEGAADFRCGSPVDEDKPAALRITKEADLVYYRLAVQQAEAVHHLKSESPIFIEWHKDPEEKMDDWRTECSDHVIFGAVLAFVYFLFLLMLFSVRYAFLGRRYQTPYDGMHGYGYGALPI